MLRGVNTDMLTVDIIARQFRCVDANAAARRAAFPTNNDPASMIELILMHWPRCVPRHLCEVRGFIGQSATDTSPFEHGGVCRSAGSQPAAGARD
jgi:hypothetical protein